MYTASRSDARRYDCVLQLVTRPHEGKGRGVSDVFRLVGFCPRCDYAIDQEHIKAMRLDSPCPRCNEERILDFYSVGSEMHYQRRQLWELGEVKGHPIPYPDCYKYPLD